MPYDPAAEWETFLDKQLNSEMLWLKSKIWVLLSLWVSLSPQLYAQSHGFSEDPLVSLQTNFGEIQVQLDPNNAPFSTQNFIDYVESGFYDGLIFHRVESQPSFSVVQGGGFDPNLNFVTPPNPPVPYEGDNGLSNLRGTIGMARTSDPNSATSQFYFNVTDNPAFDPNAQPSGFGFAVFGQVVSGLDNLDTISNVPVSTQNIPGGGSLTNVPDPNNQVIIQSTVWLNPPPETLNINQSSSPFEILTLDGDRLQLEIQGPGQVVWEVVRDQKTNRIISSKSLGIQGTDKNSQFTFKNLDQPGEISSDELTIDNSLMSLSYQGHVDEVKSLSGSKGTLELLDVGSAIAIDLPEFNIKQLDADNLGDPNFMANDPNFIEPILFAKSLPVLNVSQDIDQLQLMDANSRNRFKSIHIGGVINDSFVFGLGIDSLVVDNSSDLASAIFRTEFDFILPGSRIEHVQVKQGSVVSSDFNCRARVGRFEILNGDLFSSEIIVSQKGGEIRSVMVHSDPVLDPNDTRGNIQFSTISAARRILRIHADNVLNVSQFNTLIATRKASINLVTAKQMSGTNVSSLNIREILIGVDKNAERLAEPEGGNFTGGDISGGSISSSFTLKKVSATGQIIGVGISSGRHVTNVFAEDGLINSTVSAGINVSKIHIGYLDGNRKNIVNENADAIATINARRLGRVFYTGTRDLNLSNTRRIGTIRDDVPD